LKDAYIYFIQTFTISFGAALSALKVKQAQAKAVLALRAERCQQIAIVAIAFGLSLEKGDNNTHTDPQRDGEDPELTPEPRRF